VLPVGVIRVLQALAAAVFRHQLLDVMRGAVARDHQQVVLVAGVGDARHRPYLGIRQLAAAKRLADQRQVLERVRHPHFLARGAHADAALEVQPVGAGAEAGQAPVLVLVKLANQCEQAVGRGVDVRAEFGDFGTQAGALVIEGMGYVGQRGKGGSHGSLRQMQAVYLYSSIAVKP